jgi:DnaJ-class molecular chaperone
MNFQDALNLIPKPTKPAPVVLTIECEACEGMGNVADPPRSGDPQDDVYQECHECGGDGEVPAFCACGEPATVALSSGCQDDYICAKCDETAKGGAR